MSHWAEIDENNIVVRVVVGNNEDPNNDEGYKWIIDNLGGTWIQTSYNAIGGDRKDPNTGQIIKGQGFRKNYAMPGYTWDATRNAFIPPKPEDFFSSDNQKKFTFVLNEEKCLWEPVEIS